MHDEENKQEIRMKGFSRKVEQGASRSEAGGAAPP